MSRNLPIFVILIATTLNSVLANPTPEVRFLAEVIPNDLGEVVLAGPETRSDPFDLPMNNLSRIQEAPARAFRLWSVDLNRPLANVMLPEEGNSFIILLLRAQKEADLPYSPVVMPADNPSFNGGDIYFYNNTRFPVVGQLGDSRFSLEPGEGSVETPRGHGSKRYYHVMLGTRENGKNRLIKSMKWPHSTTARHYVFFYLDPRKGRVTYRSVDEFLTR